MAEVTLQSVVLPPEDEENTGVQQLTIPQVQLPDSGEFAPEFSSENIDKLVQLERQKQQPDFTKSFAKLKQQLAGVGGLTGTPLAQLGAVEIAEQESSLAGFRQDLTLQGLLAEQRERTDELAAKRNLAALTQEQLGQQITQIKGQEFATQEREASQEFSSAEREAAQEFSKDVLLTEQEFQEQQAQLNRQFTAAENQLGREFTTQEREAIQQFNSLESENQRSFESAEAALDRQFTTTEREAIQEWQAAQQQIQNDFEAAMQLDRQAFQSAEAQDDRDYQRALDLVNAISNGTLKPSAADLTFLKNQGFDGEFQDKVTLTYGLKPDGTKFGSVQEAESFWQEKNANMELMHLYGTDENGNAFISEQAALAFWEKKGFNSEMIQMYGKDPATGMPFTSESKAREYWDKQGASARLNQMYGTKTVIGSDGLASQVPFTSEAEAKQYWTAKSLDLRFGKKEDGSSFGSEAEALNFWKEKEADSSLLQKFGTRPVSNPDGTVTQLPFTSEAEALDYYESKGYSKELTRKYGVNKDGSPFKTEFDAIQHQKEEIFQKQLEQIKDPGVRAAINDSEEFNFFLEYGRTYEDEMAHIIEDANTLEKWRKNLPRIQTLYNLASAQLDRELQKPDGWTEAVFGGGRDQGEVDRLKEQKLMYEQAIADIRANKIPILPDGRFQ